MDERTEESTPLHSSAQATIGSCEAIGNQCFNVEANQSIYTHRNSNLTNRRPGHPQMETVGARPTEQAP